MEIKWDILLLLLCLSHTICRRQYSAAIYQSDPLILTDLIKETHWQPFYLRGSSMAIKDLLLTHIFTGCYCKDWLSEQLEVTGFIALLHQRSRPYTPWYPSVLVMIMACGLIFIEDTELKVLQRKIWMKCKGVSWAYEDNINNINTYLSQLVNGMVCRVAKR